MEREKVEFIESYIKNPSGDYQWNGNHGALVRCRDCRRKGTLDCPIYAGAIGGFVPPDDWFCACGERR